jgi:predicted permease
MEGLLQDALYASRTLRRSPGFTLTVILALALGIGTTSAILSVVDAVLLKPLPYAEPSRLVQLWLRFTGLGLADDRNWVSWPEYRDLEQSRAFSQLAATKGGSFNVTFGGTPERLASAAVTPSFFPLLGVRAQVGRVFLEEEGKPGRDHVVLLGDGIWRRHFGADRTVPGRKLIMYGESYLVVGVLPRGFQLPREADIWVPLAPAADDFAPGNRLYHELEVIARLKPGFSVQQARADLAVIAQRMIAANPQFPYRQAHFGVLVVPLLEQQVGDIASGLWVLLAAVGLVLLIACANVAGLLLVRASAREREIAIRLALGVGRRRLLRQLLTESVILSLLGGAAGLALARWALPAVIALGASALPRIAEVRLDLPVLVATLILSLLTGILFGLAPAAAAFRSGGSGGQAALKEGGRGGTSGAGARRLRSTLVVGEIALSLALLAGSGLLIRSFLHLQQVDAGFRPAGVLSLRVALADERYEKPEKTRAFFRDVLGRVRALPGVDAAGAVDGLPLSGTGWSGQITVDSQLVPAADTTPEADQRPVTPGYFQALGIPLLRGRYIEERDTAAAPRVCVIDETMAKTYWPGQDAIGKRVHHYGLVSPAGEGAQPWLTVVGVVRHVRYRSLEAPSRVELYFPDTQIPFAVSTMSVVVHTVGDPLALAEPVRLQVQAADPNQPVYQIHTMSELVSDSLMRRRLSMYLLALFAGMALLHSAVGLYGLMSYSVAQRAHEMGIRVALGARTAGVIRLVLGDGARLAATGIVIGLAAALVLTQLLSSLLFAVKAYDPVTFVLAAALLLLVAMLASFVPAYRATTVDPVKTLRQE